MIEEGSVAGQAIESRPLPYWKQYRSETLNGLMASVAEQNYTLTEAIARINQARSQLQVAGAGQYPTVNISGTARRSRIETGEVILSAGFRPVGSLFQNQFGLTGSLSYELDLWGRVASARRAEEYRLQSSEYDLQNVILSLSRDLFSAWMDVLEAVQLTSVLESQLSSSETFLELTELRFSLGRGTALDVFEQRQQLASLRAQVPQVQLAREQALHRLAVLIGEVPGSVPVESLGAQYPHLPTGVMQLERKDLITLRPDLQSLLHQLQANEYDVAAAVANRFPRLSIGLTYDLSASEANDLFPNKFLSGFGDILLPFIDGGRLRGIVNREEAEVEQLIAQFEQRFLVALQEVEDSLAAERFQRELIGSLEAELEAANKALQESRSRYRNGLVDYLRVLVALQTKQRLERSIIGEQKRLYLARNALFLAIGGKLPLEGNDDEVKNRIATSGERDEWS
ncbi:efflux transporter outer membrane subunit [bacterium]|nr:efflux transporter outer membrane subunit [bacterium]